MFERRFTELKVGVFVAAGLVLAMVVIFMIGSTQRFFEKQFAVFAHFDTIAGLRVGAPVQLSGLKVGFVDDIRFPKELDQTQITVVMRINREYQERIREDSVATIETQGLLGDKYIYISVGSAAQKVIPDKGIIASKETTSIFALAEKAGSIMDNIGDASESLNEIMSMFKGKEGETDVKAALKSMRKSIEGIEKGNGFLHALIYDPRGEEVVAGLADLLGSFKGQAASVDGKTKGSLIVNLSKSASDLEKILSMVEKGDGTLGKLVNDPTLYDNLKSLTGRASRNNALKQVIRTTIDENERQ